MTPLEKDRLEALCNRWGLKELNFTKGIFIDDNTGITMNLRGDVPIVGVTIAGTLHTEGHGNLKVPDLQTEVDQVMKAKPIPKTKTSLSLSTEQHRSDLQDTAVNLQLLEKNKLGTHDTSKKEVKDDNIQSSKRQDNEPNITTRPRDREIEQKGGQESPLHKKGTTTAICQGCSCIINGTLDTFQKIQKEYGTIYCQKCIEKADGKINTHATPPAKPVAIKICNVCGLELSGARALECFQRDPQKPIMICVDCECKIKPEEPTVIKGKSMSGELTPTKPGANVPVKKSDQERDDEIELAKAERFLKNQGSSYSVSGKNRPDSAMVQKFANTVGISSEIIFAEQTKDYAHVVVRGHRGDSYIDAVVHHDFETEFQLQTMEIIKKNPEILDHYDGLLPVIKEGAKIESGNKVVDAKYYLIHTLLSFKTFSLRDATTKAMSIAQMKLLNQDAREPEEVASEQKERDLVDDKRSQRR